MKDLKDIFQSQKFESLDVISRRNKLLEDMTEFFVDGIPAEILERFNEGEWIDYVGENLQTHNFKLLQIKLEKTFGNKIEEFIDQTDQSGIFAIVTNDDDLHRDPKFIHLLNFFNYFIRERIQNRYIIEPIYSECKNDWVYKNCNGIVYHFTDNETAKKILANGLRIKGRNEQKFQYPARIYLYAPGYYLNKSNINDWLPFVKEVVDPVKVKTFGLAVLKIDLNKGSKTGIYFYRDTAMGEDAVFTYNNIPKTFITKLKFN